MHKHTLLPLALGLLLAVPNVVAQAQSSQAVSHSTPVSMDVTSPRQPYAFFPQGGNLYGDLYLQNFYDLDASAGLLDWSGTDYTINGETGEDVLLRSFVEQDKGVRVFAALDGTVSQAVYNDPADHNTSGGSGLGNYVTLEHGSGQQTSYFSLAYSDPGNPDPTFTPLHVGQAVKAGTQIGYAASSGVSTAPHLHFQSSLNGQTFEPFAGTSRPGPSWWVQQPGIRRDLYLEVFNMDAGNVGSPSPSSDLPRQGSFQSGAVNTGCWTILHNLPANSTFRLRWLRPDATVYHEASGSFVFPGSSAFQRTLEYWWNYNWTPGLDQVGTWHLELSINSHVVQAAPFRVVASLSTATNRAPYAVTATLDPAQPTASDAVFCHVATTPGQDGAPVVVDPDSDFVYYHYQWLVTGSGSPHVVREVDSAGHADAIPWGLGNAGNTLRCNVTPVDVHGVPGPTASVSVTLASRTAVQIAAGADNAPRLLWTTPAGLVSLWRVDSAGNHTYRTYGPYPGYTPRALAVGADNIAHILWNNVNGQVVLWKVDAAGNFGYTLFGPVADSTAIGLAVGPDNRVRILWANANGQISLWTIAANGTYTHAEYGPYAGWTAQALALGPNGLPRILWTNPNGHVALWTIQANGTFTSSDYGPYAGWTPVSLAVGPDNNTHILWDNTDGHVSLWNVAAGGGFTHREYGPFAGWTANSLTVGANNAPRLIWTNVGGSAALWNINGAGNYTAVQYGL